MVSRFQPTQRQYKIHHQIAQRELSMRSLRFLKLVSKKLGAITLAKPKALEKRSICLVTGKMRGVYTSKFRLSRHAVKLYFSYLKSLRISSW